MLACFITFQITEPTFLTLSLRKPEPQSKLELSKELYEKDLDLDID